MIKEYKGKRPKIHPTAFIAETAVLIGDVIIEENASIWYGAILRGDINSITVGKNSNVQDGSVIHVADDFPVVIGDNVTIGHNVVVHACRIEDQCLIGMGATILDGAIIEKKSIIGANALITQNKTIPSYSLVGGVPAKHLRTISEDEAQGLYEHAQKYCKLAEGYKSENL